MTERFRDSTAWPDTWPALVRCPRCDACARMTAVEGPRDGVRLTCPSCALARDGRAYGVRSTDGTIELHPLADGRTWRDPGTREISTWPDTPPQAHPLWLRTSCCGGRILWAVNDEHLAYLEGFIGAELRERPDARIGPTGRRWIGKGLSWKLPDWMKSAKHRDEVMGALADLRATLPGPGR